MEREILKNQKYPAKLQIPEIGFERWVRNDAEHYYKEELSKLVSQDSEHYG